MPCPRGRDPPQGWGWSNPQPCPWQAVSLVQRSVRVLSPTSRLRQPVSNTGEGREQLTQAWVPWFTHKRRHPGFEKPTLTHRPVSCHSPRNPQPHTRGLRLQAAAALRGWGGVRQGAREQPVLDNPG